MPTLSVLLLSCLAHAGANSLRVLLAAQLSAAPQLAGVLMGAAALLAVVLDFMVRCLVAPAAMLELQVALSWPQAATAAACAGAAAAAGIGCAQERAHALGLACLLGVTLACGGSLAVHLTRWRGGGGDKLLQHTT